MRGRWSGPIICDGRLPRSSMLLLKKAKLLNWRSSLAFDVSNKHASMISTWKLLKIGRYWFPHGGSRRHRPFGSRDFYTLDTKIDEVARALGVMWTLGWDTDVTALVWWARTRCFEAKLLLENQISCCRPEPTNYLDAEHIDWLKRYLQNYENALFLFRIFLSKRCNQYRLSR